MERVSATPHLALAAANLAVAAKPAGRPVAPLLVGSPAMAEVIAMRMVNAFATSVTAMVT